MDEHQILQHPLLTEKSAVELTHRATSRDNFARGALLAARWIVDQPAGLYAMPHLLKRGER
jgi:dihydrodipicolinate reductase